MNNQIKQVKDSAYKLYSGQTRSYKQKVLYNLLAAAKSKDRFKFLNILDTNLNGIVRSDQSKSLLYDLKDNYECIQGVHFEKYAYAIIAGIMASKDRPNSMEGEKNE